MATILYLYDYCMEYRLRRLSGDKMTRQYDFTDHIYQRNLNDLKTVEADIKKAVDHHRKREVLYIKLKALRTWALRYELKIVASARSEVKTAA